MVFGSFYRIVCFKIVILLWFIKNNKGNTTPYECESPRNSGCCDGYFLNPETRICTKCMAGYYGPNCIYQCPYPSYGEKCQGTCDCSNLTCDASNGCTMFSTVTTESTYVGKYRTTNFTSKLSGTNNGLLLLLIQMFGAADVLLLCIYSIAYIDDHKNRSKLQTENIRRIVPRNNSMDTNIEIVFLQNE